MPANPELLSWWQRSAPSQYAFEPSLSDSRSFDIAIVGAGFTGLWTAYYLQEANPGLNICILERDFVGFGASGRNGGWCVGELAASNAAYERKEKGGALRMLDAIHETVDEVGRISQFEGIDCDYAKGGALYVAVNKRQMKSFEAKVKDCLDHGAAPTDGQILSAEETRKRLNIKNIHGGLFHPHCAALQPFKLAAGLGQVVAEKGVKLFENSEVLEIGEKSLTTERATVKADVIVRATEGYTRTIKGYERAILPFHSYMIATQPFTDAQWDEIGLKNREVFSDGRNLIYHGLRTGDNRLAIGGLTIHYRYGSNTELNRETINVAGDRLKALVEDLFPSLGTIEVAHKWGGVLGIPRDYVPSVGFDKNSGLAWGGGYVGEGVAASNLAGRCLADLITERQTDLATLPWINHRSRNWEPEPLRWVGAAGGQVALSFADRLAR